MVRSVITDTKAGRSIASDYAYDAFGRRTLTQDTGGETMRTLYDGMSFEVIRESAVFANGSFTTNYSTGQVTAGNSSEQRDGGRYRWIGEDADSSRYRYIGDGEESTLKPRYTGVQVTLYGRGEPVAMNRTSSAGNGRGGTAYLGKDILGSVRSVTNETGQLEDRYEYDAFGKPYQGDLDNGMNLGYMGKPYDSNTGLYNYGYRDYKPEAARFTTIDPIRDGSNWFVYVNNDPVNYVDLWGLSVTEPEQQGPVFPTDSTRITSTMGDDHPYGIDVGAQTAGVAGDPIVSPVDGTIVTAGVPDWSTAGIPYVVVRDDNGYDHRMAHGDIPETTQVGDRVEAGDEVATMSDIGSPGQVHMHYDVIGPNGRENPLDLYPDTDFTLPGE